MSIPKLHIISFDVPYPADYGGAIDVFYKIKSLAEAGCEIYLHCFEYRRPHTDVLRNLCKEVWYYPRLTGIKGVSFRYPYIVYSRRNERLLRQLQEINAPVLFEGIHCTYYANHPSLIQRTKILRAHNVEHEYYKQLAAKNSGIVSKIYFSAEAFLLRKYELSLKNVNSVLCLSHTDKQKFETLYPDKTVAFVAPFHPFTTNNIPIDGGDYCLYHGNLRHPENEEAALFLLENVIPNTKQTNFVIAGRNPSQKIKRRSKKLSNCNLVENPDEQTMRKLIREAHINVLPTFQRAGMKLKLLYALFNGKHVLANDDMIYGTQLENVCTIANSSEEFVAAINALMQIKVTETMQQRRATILDKHYNNQLNAQRIITFLQQRSL